MEANKIHDFSYVHCIIYNDRIIIAYILSSELHNNVNDPQIVAL